MPQHEQLPPLLDESVGTAIELPDLADLDNPALKRAIERVRAAKTATVPQAHSKHKSFNKKVHSRGWW